MAKNLKTLENDILTTQEKLEKAPTAGLREEYSGQLLLQVAKANLLRKEENLLRGKKLSLLELEAEVADDIRREKKKRREELEVNEKIGNNFLLFYKDRSLTRLC
jgi:hypothetical protein